MDIPLSTFGNCQRHWKKLYKGLIYVEQSPNKEKNYVAFLIRGLTARILGNVSTINETLT